MKILCERHQDTTKNEYDVYHCKDCFCLIQKYNEWYMKKILGYSKEKDQSIRSKQITYEYKVAADGFVRHKPCWYTLCMNTAAEGIKMYGDELKKIYQKSKREELTEADKEWKELCRWFLNSCKGEMVYNTLFLKLYCEGVYACKEEDILIQYLEQKQVDKD